MYRCGAWQSPYLLLFQFTWQAHQKIIQRFIFLLMFHSLYCIAERKTFFYYIIVQTDDVGLHSNELPNISSIDCKYLLDRLIRPEFKGFLVHCCSVHTYMNTHIYTHIHAFTYTYTYMHTHIHTHIYTRTHAHARSRDTHTRARGRTHVCTLINTS